MKILHVSTEFAHVAKVGGLGDVVHSLSKALREKNVDAAALLPLYDSIHLSKKKADSFSIFFDGKPFSVSIWEGVYDGIPLFFVDPEADFFRRGTIYGCPDDASRFAFFCAAAATFIEKKPELDVIHLHDWPTALTAPLLKNRNPERKIALTLHNIEHQGRCEREILSAVGFPGGNSLIEREMSDPIYPEAINLLVGGILYADALIAVSPTYSQEIQTKEGGQGLDPLFRSCRGKLHGILNGIDIEHWNPARDPNLPYSYSAQSSETDLLSGKEACRKKLSSLVGIKNKEAPLFGCVTRLASQKGPELLALAIDYIKEKGGQCVLLGSIADPRYEKEFLERQAKALLDPDVSIELHSSDKLAHLIFAATDFFLLPSHFEPCGLTQMISMRYGTIPIARKTGGLIDTVFDVTNPRVPPEEATGFTFTKPNKEDFFDAIDRAFAYWQTKKAKLHILQKQVMQKDWSWNKTISSYLAVYKKLLP